METNTVADYVYRHNNVKGMYMVLIASASVFLDVWDLTAFGFVLTFFKATFLPVGIILGVSVAAANIGAIAGAILGGYLTDKFGRKRLLIYNMAVFVVFSFLIAVSTNIYQFIAFRLVVGFSIGSDVATGFSYIYEYISRGQRNHYYSLWAYSFSVVALIAVGSVFFLTREINNDSVWRYIFVIGGVFAAVILLLRTKITETPVWLYGNGKYRETKDVVKKVYGEDLDIGDSVERDHITVKNLINLFHKGLNRDLIFTFSLNGIVGFIGWGFGFYITYMLAVLKFLAFYQVLEADAIIYAFGFMGALLSPHMARHFGIYKSAVIPAIVASVAIFALFLTFDHIFPVYFVIPLSIVIIFMNYCGPMAYNAVLNEFIPTSLRGVGNGWNYMFNKITEAVSGLTSGAILVIVGLRFNTVILFLIVGSFTVIALVAGRSGYFRNHKVSDFHTSPDE
ncbi:MFS transporter [Ferroplasma sp.]|uniref:MFS transporter n=1 Tax=Ferroplasma sp. TaxID=2591003 RepID=UPI002627D233|nr:MFS transporter [Ferroplasma sp.]MCL4453868.1 MFS transporter [Candidatus Thermoplasmatota archaeon]